MKEFEVEAVVEYVFTRSGARFPAFPTIVGSGPNSCVLHYTRNDRTIEAGDLIVLDAGAEFGRYAADVTRTLPASGRFSDEQLRVYRAVLRAQEEARSLLRPGVRIRDLHERAAKVLEEAGLREAFLHGCCHFVGLDVHDRGSRDVELAPGMVLTIEPGAYLVDRGFGVRIEDTFLVTEDRHERLSACVPSAPEEVEAEMAAGKGVSRSGSASPPR
jgi:Xaa-Pro aminopeptidase